MHGGKELKYYPLPGDPKYQEKIYNKKEFHIYARENPIAKAIEQRPRGVSPEKVEEASFSKVCRPSNTEEDDTTAAQLTSSFLQSELGPHQKFAKNFMSPETPNRKVMLMYGTGTGKTLAAITIAEKNFKPHIQAVRQNTPLRPFIYIIASTDAIQNFIKELLTDFIQPSYITPAERSKLQSLHDAGTKYSLEEYEKLRKHFIDRLKKPSKGGYYKFMGYEEFVNRTVGARARTDTGIIQKTKTGNVRRKVSRRHIENMDESVLIIDEAHRIEGNEREKAITYVFSKYKNIRIVLLTATPMMNSPKEIIHMLNLLLPFEKQLKTNEIFEDTTTELSSAFGQLELTGGTEATLPIIKPGALEKIGNVSRGYISYLRGANPYTFPKRIDMGTINYDAGFQYLHLIQCPMSDLQMNTYLSELGKSKRITEDLRHLMDMCIPNPDNKNIGLYKTQQLLSLEKASPAWLHKNGIELIKITKKLVTDKSTSEASQYLIFGGPFIKQSRIREYSGKFYQILQNLDNSLHINSGPIFIFNEWIRGIGILQFQEILKANGYEEYQQHLDIETNKRNYKDTTKCALCGLLPRAHNPKNKHSYVPAKFILIIGLDSDPQERRPLINLINNIKNANGSIVKIILGSGVTKESIDLKRIREVHVVNFQFNIPSIDQIVGRAIRHCSHWGLRRADREVRVFLYASVFPKKYRYNKLGYYKLTYEEERYLLAEKKHIVIKQIERVLKENAVDCPITKQENVFEEELQTYKNCEKKGTCPAVCDYQNCNYKCTWEPPLQPGSQIKYKHYNIKDLDTSTYMGFIEDELTLIKKIVKYLIKQNVFISETSILEKLNELKKTDEQFKFVSQKNVPLALKQMIEEHDIVRNPNGLNGQLQFVKHGEENYYLFIPANSNPDVGLQFRFQEIKRVQVQHMKLSDYMTRRQIGKIQTEHTQKNIIEGLKHATTGEAIAKILGNLSLEKQKDILEEAIKADILQKQPSYKISVLREMTPEIFNKILGFYRDYLVTNRQIESSAFISSEAYSTAKVKRNDIYIGHLIDKTPRCLDESGGWHFCVRDISKPQEKTIRENPLLVGVMEKTKSGQMVFKIRPPHNESDQYRDRRKIQKGFVCSRTSDKSTLMKYSSMLNLKVAPRASIKEICEIIQDELRKREHSEKGEKLKWFYEYIETL